MEMKDYFSREKVLIQNLRLRDKWMQITGNTVKALTLCNISLHIYLYQKIRCLEEIKTTPKHKNLVGFYTRNMSIWNQ